MTRIIIAVDEFMFYFLTDNMELENNEARPYYMSKNKFIFSAFQEQIAFLRHVYFLHALFQSFVKQLIAL